MEIKEEYKSFGEFLVRTPTNFVHLIAWTFLSVLMLIAAIATIDILNPIIFWILVILFTVLPLGVFLRIYITYKKIKNGKEL
tara:strand:+ start:2500 stop:2745 length:246 start_codon:yes stop_codon:yes gene_type:complete